MYCLVNIILVAFVAFLVFLVFEVCLFGFRVVFVCSRLEILGLKKKAMSELDLQFEFDLSRKCS